MSEAHKDYSNVAAHRESCLHYLIGDGAKVAGSSCGLAIREQSLKGHLNLRGDPEDEGFRSAVSQVLGVDLPTVPGSFNSNADSSIYWLGPTEWLVIVACGNEVEVEVRLRETLTGHYSVVDVSGGQTLLTLSGEAVAMVLKKSSVYDFHHSQFTQGRCVQTTFAKASALVSRTSKNSFDLVVRRSFSDYLFKWIVDAACEYDVEVLAEG